MRHILAIALVSMAALVYGNAEATVFVVDATPPACVNPSGGVFVPTIGAAVAAAAAGDRIYVCPGTYAENVIVPDTKPNLTLLGIDRPKVVPGDPNPSGFAIFADGVRIQGFEVAGFNGNSFSCGIGVAATSVQSQANGVIVAANVLHDNANGICFINAGGNQARDNTTERNFVGIFDFAVSSFPPNLIIGNRAQNNGVGIGAEGATPRVDMNTVSGNSQFGIAFQFSPGGLISRNTVTKNGVGIQVDSSCCFEIDHNVVRESVAEGIEVFFSTGCSVDDNSVARNGADGMLLTVQSCKIDRNTVLQNQGIGIDAVNLGPGNTFSFNAASGNHGAFDCNWDGSDAPSFVGNRCATENPPGAWD